MILFLLIVSSQSAPIYINDEYKNIESGNKIVNIKGVILVQINDMNINTLSKQTFTILFTQVFNDE